MHKVLFLGAHVDDVELGCGGTLYKYRNKWNRICVTLSKSSYSPEGIDGKYPDLWRHQVEALAQLECELQVFAHRTNFFEEERNAIWQTLANLRDAVTPDMVFVNAPDDQQDHACLYRETLRVFQKTSVICYPTYGSTQNFQMNYYEGLSKKDVQKKIAAINCYPMYKDKIYFTNIESHLRSTGTYTHQKFAEGFCVVKLVIPVHQKIGYM